MSSLIMDILHLPQTKGEGEIHLHFVYSIVLSLNEVECFISDDMWEGVKFQKNCQQMYGSLERDW